jgi:hypothetical protein
MGASFQTGDREAAFRTALILAERGPAFNEIVNVYVIVIDAILEARADGPAGGNAPRAGP